MANTYTQIYIHIVFSAQSRQKLISEQFRENLHSYIGGIIKNKGHKPLAINSIPDHIHIFLGIKPKESISDLVREIKTNSSKYSNENGWIRGKFS